MKFSYKILRTLNPRLLINITHFFHYCSYSYSTFHSLLQHLPQSLTIYPISYSHPPSISLLESLQRSMESQKPPWPSRTKRGARSGLSDAEQDLQPLIDTSSPMSRPTSNKRRTLSTTLQKEEEESLSSTPVSRLPNKKKTSNDQFNNSKTTAQCTTKSFRTSPQVSTSSARDLHPFWTKSKKEASRKLWSPTETDWLVSESTFLKVPSKKHGTILDVVSKQQTDHQGTQEELGQDLLALCNYFVAKNNGRREPLPMLEVDAKGTSLKIPKLESEGDRKKVTKELGSGVATKKIKLHPRTQEDRQWLRKMFGIAPVGTTIKQ